MSRLGSVIKNKNKRQKFNEQRRKDELTSLKLKTAYQAKLMSALNYVDALLDSGEVDKVKIAIEEKYMVFFSEEIYKETLAEYEVTQADTPLTFYIQRRYIAL